jgi:DNA-binding MarR family transcriptional regulator
MTKDADDLVETIAGIRRCFWLLAAVSDEMVADLGLTASLRAVIEYLHEHGAATVPQIAAEKAVKRQSIQALVDQLRELGLVSTRENPAHKRSVLIALTTEGAATYRTVRQRERVYLRGLRNELNTGDLARTARTLEAMTATLRHMVKGESDDDN